MRIEGNKIIFKSAPEFFIKGIQDKPPYSIQEFEGKEIEEVIKFHAEFEEGQKKWIRIVGTHDPSLFFEREISDITWLSYFHGGKYGGAYIYGFAWEKKEKLLVTKTHQNKDAIGIFNPAYMEQTEEGIV